MENGVLISIIGPITTGVVGFLFFLTKSMLPAPEKLKDWATQHIWGHGVWVLVSGILLSTTFVFLGLWLAPRNGDITQMVMEITAPEVRANMPYHFKVEGFLAGKLGDQCIWVAVRPHTANPDYGNQHFVQAATTIVRDQRMCRWNALVNIETYMAESGSELDILALLVDTQAAEILESHERTRTGIPDLPKGGVVYDEITVTLE